VGLLDDIKKQADTVKAQDTDQTESLRANAVAVDLCLRRAFAYLNDLGKQLNVVKMPSPFVFKLATVGDIGELTFKDFFSDFRTKLFIDKDYYSEVHMTFRAGSEKVLQIKKGPDDMEKFRNILWQNNIEHKSEQYRNERKVITHEIFEVKCDFRIACKIEGDHETGKLKIMTKNVGIFEVDVHLMTAQELNDPAIEDLAKYMIGRPNNWLDHIKRSVLNQRTAAPVAPKPKPAPQYVRPPAPPAEPPPEEKKGLFGSIKNLIKKSGE
jgi:hypothetical protein